MNKIGVVSMRVMLAAGNLKLLGQTSWRSILLPVPQGMSEEVEERGAISRRRSSFAVRTSCHARLCS